jgi:hypothetical protein
MIKKKNCAVVYWLYDSTCRDPMTDGYVGCTLNYTHRIRCHRKYGRFKKFKHKILFEGTSAECAAEERRFRPQPNIGWNIHVGGLYVLTPEVIAKRSAIMRAAVARGRQRRGLPSQPPPPSILGYIRVEELRARRAKRAATDA